MALAPRWKLFALRLLVLLAVPVFLAFTVNALRPHGLAFIATQPYEIFTDCPEATVQSDAVSLETARKRLADFALVDARPPEDAASSPLANTFSLPYDELFPVSPSDLERLNAKRGKHPVLVVGSDGANAKLLADDLRSQGVKDVHYLDASAPELAAAR